MTEVQGVALLQRSLVAEETILFGAALMEGTAAGQAKKISTTGDDLFVGVAMNDPAKTAQYVQYDDVRVCKLGLVPVILEKTEITANAEDLPEGTPIKISTNATGVFMKGATGTMEARLAEDGSFAAATAAQYSTHVRLAYVGVS